MKRERGIIFTGESVRAILAGRKTQTRRVVRLHPETGYIVAVGGKHRWHRDDPAAIAGCPYGVPGDRLWVRETWCRSYDLDTERPVEPPQCLYRATEDRHIVHYEGGENADGTERSPWRSPLLMPRLASRLMLEIVAVRVERVQGISREDIEAEGLPPEEWYRVEGGPEKWWRTGWQNINGGRPGCAWSDNPWVWVVEFRRVEA